MQRSALWRVFIKIHTRGCLLHAGKTMKDVFPPDKQERVCNSRFSLCLWHGLLCLQSYARVSGTRPHCGVCLSMHLLLICAQMVTTVCIDPLDCTFTKRLLDLLFHLVLVILHLTGFACIISSTHGMTLLPCTINAYLFLCQSVLVTRVA